MSKKIKNIKPELTTSDYELICEVLAWPISSISSIMSNIIDFEECNSYPMGETRVLAKNLASSLISKSNEYSLEYINNIIKRVWFDELNQPDVFFDAKDNKISLEKYIIKIAKSLLTLKGDVVLNDSSKSLSDLGHPKLSYSVDVAKLFNLLTNYIPQSLLTAALIHVSSEVPRNRFNKRIKIVNKKIINRLKGNLSEQHLHLNGGYSFYHLWFGAILPINLEKQRSKDDQGYLFLRHYEQIDLKPFVFISSIIRLLICEILFVSNISKNHITVLDYEETIRIIKENYNIHDSPFIEFVLDNPRVAFQNLSENKDCFDTNFFKQIRELKNLFYKVNKNFCYNSKDFLHTNDPVIDRFCNENCDYIFDPDYHLIFYALKYIEINNNNSDVNNNFRYLFWLYIKVKNIFYQNITQPKSNLGLSNFTKYFNKIDSFKNHIDNPLEEVLNYSSANDMLNNIEVRVAPNLRYKKFKNKVDRLIKEYLSCKFNNLNFGIIVHFIKNEYKVYNDSNNYEYCVPSSMPDTLNLEPRYWKIIRDTIAQYDSLCRLIISNPEYRFFIRGVDICNRELAVPSWVYAPFFRGIRDLLTSNDVNGDKELPPIHFTVHAGEEYYHPIQGLRNIWESLHFFNFSHHDRIGHGVALGEIPQQYYKNNTTVSVPYSTYLFDILFELYLYRNNVLFDHSIENYLEKELHSILQTLFKNCDYIKITSNIMCRFYESLFYWEYMELFPVYSDGNVFKRKSKTAHQALLNKLDHKVNSKKADIIGDNPREALEVLQYIFLYNTPMYLFEKMSGLKIVTVDKMYKKRHKLIRKCILERMNKYNIVVECCPSSNITIGKIDSYAEHPIFAFCPPGKKAKIHATINSDDPVVFNTTLEEEFCHIAQVLEEKYNYNYRQIYNYLSALCDTAKDSNFTVDIPDYIYDYFK